MTKKGFTLIELLAVIVILAVIALISVPMILGVIDKARLGALEDSAYGLIDSANLYYSSNIQNGMDTIEFTCNESGCINGDKKLSYKGSIDSGKVKIYSDGKISVCIENGTNAAIKKATEKKVKTAENGSCNTSNDEYSIDEVVSLTKYNELKQQYDDLKSKGNANEAEILESKTAVSNGTEITGTMSNQSNKTLLSTTISRDTADITKANIRIPSNGYYDTTSKIQVPIDAISSLDSSSKIDSLTSFDSWSANRVIASTSHTTTFTSDVEGMAAILYTQGGYASSSLSVSVSGATYKTLISAGTNGLSQGWGWTARIAVYHFKAKAGDSITFSYNLSKVSYNVDTGGWYGNVMITK